MYKIIIADDEKIIRMGLKEILDWEELGFEIQEVFSDGEEVIEYLEYTNVIYFRRISDFISEILFSTSNSNF